jgi:hypothetical protein
MVVTRDGRLVDELQPLQRPSVGPAELITRRRHPAHIDSATLRDAVSGRCGRCAAASGGAVDDIINGGRASRFAFAVIAVARFTCSLGDGELRLRRALRVAHFQAPTDELLRIRLVDTVGLRSPYDASFGQSLPCCTQ